METTSEKRVCHDPQRNCEPFMNHGFEACFKCDEYRTNEDKEEFLRKIKPISNPTCFACNKMNICFAFKEIHNALRGLKINIDTNDLPGKITDVYISLAKCCFLYKTNIKK